MKMQRFGGLAAAILLFPSIAAAQNSYGWSLSESQTDPCVNSGVPTFTLKTLYLWHTYNVGSPVVAFEFDGFSGSIVPLTFTPASGWWEPDFPIPPPYTLFNFTCPAAPTLVAAMLVLDTGGNTCLGTPTAVDCETETAWPSGSTGWASDGSDPCEHYVNGRSGCDQGPVSVESSGWGSVKAMYR